MADPESDETVSVPDRDEESNKKRRLSDSTEASAIPRECKRFCCVRENTPGSSGQDGDGTPHKSLGTVRLRSSECKGSLSVPGEQVTRMASPDFPSKLSEWKRKHIENLNISIVYVPDTKPLDLIQRGEIQNYEESRTIMDLQKHVQRSRIMANLRSLERLYTCFSELSSESLWEMAPNGDENLSMIPPWLPEQHMMWFYRFHCQAQDFGNLLYLVLKRRENGCSVGESHVQALFEAFARMFGLNSGLSRAPCLDVDARRIMRRDVSGAADVVFPCRMFSPSQRVKQGTQHPSVVAVCKVKKDSPRMNSCEDSAVQQMSSSASGASHHKTTSSASGASHHRTTPHLDDEVIGQHVGELLFHYPDTIKKGNICGLIVQGTQITFTMLEMSGEHYNDIVEGTVKDRGGDQPTLKVSKPYDYLTTQDRGAIIEAFIKLARLQRTIL